MLECYVHLFLIDLVRLKVNDNFPFYEKTEPGYGAAMLHAYIKAFSMEGTKGLMSHELIQAIHREAMPWNKEIKGFVGKYKNTWNNYLCNANNMTIHGKRIDNVSYSLSEQGIFEFIEYWFINNHRDTHTMTFSKPDDNTKGFVIIGYDASFKQFICNQCDMTKPRSKDISLDYEALKKTIHEFIQGEYTKVSIDVFPKEPEDDIGNLTQVIMTIIIYQYNQEIVKCYTPEEKIRCVMRHIQHIDQVHPFLDGNIRTCYILANKLFADLDLGLCLFLNPNRFDMCSLDELCQMAKLGFGIYSKVNSEQHTKEIVIQTEESIGSLRELKLPPYLLKNMSQDLVAKFCSIVINRATPGSVSQHALGFFGDAFCGISAIDQPIGAKNYGLAFRRACFGAKAVIIQRIIENFKDAINFEEVTSKNETGVTLLKQNKLLSEAERASLSEMIASSIQAKNLKYRKY